MGEKNFNFEPTYEKKPLVPYTQKNIQRSPAGTREDYKIPEKAKSEKLGHLAEEAICDWLKRLPGVSDARLSSSIEDKEKVDIFVKLAGDSEPIKLQVSMNPKKTAERLPPDICFIKLRPEDIRGKTITASLQKQIAKKIIKRMPFDKMEGLLGYHGID